MRATFALAVLFATSAAVGAQTPPTIAPNTTVPPGTELPMVGHVIHPAIPPAARRAGLRGTVFVAGIVDTNGLLTGAQVVRTCLSTTPDDGVMPPCLEIDDAARLVALGKGSDSTLGLAQVVVDAMKQWRFRPAMRDGAPVNLPVMLSLTATGRR